MHIECLESSNTEFMIIASLYSEATPPVSPFYG